MNFIADANKKPKKKIVLNEALIKKEAKKLATQNKLEELRLQTESQNVRLLKIQQEERVAGEEYRQKKKEMEKTLEELAARAEVFNDEQKKMNTDLESKKETVIMTNDLRKKQEEDKSKRDKELNRVKKEEIKTLKQRKLEQENHLKFLQKEVKKYKIYEEFLERVAEKMPEMKKDDKTIMEIINQHKKMKKHQKEFGDSYNEIEKLKEEKQREIIRMTNLIEQERYSFTSDTNQIKNAIASESQSIRGLSTNLKADYDMNNTKTSEYGQIILAIKNLHSQAKVVDMKEQDAPTKNESDSTESLLKKLKEISMRLKYLTDLTREYEKWEKENAKELKESTKL